ncbi:MAG: flippase [Gammaproteobacteria bacterium]|nr:flippase [Gammaproteobacteria bacterium]
MYNFNAFFRVQLNIALRKVITNVSWLFVDRMIRMLLGLFVGVWVARYLGPEQFGLLNYAIAFVALFSAFPKLGLNDIVIRNILHKPVNANETLGTAFFLMLSSGGITLIFTILVCYLVHGNDQFTFWLVTITSAGLIFQAFDFVDFWYQSQVSSKYVIWSREIGFILCSLVKIVLIVNNANLIWFAWVGMLEIAIGSIFMIAVYHFKEQSIFKLKVSLECARSMLRDSWPIVFQGLAIMVYMRIDQVMLGEFAGSSEVGIYSVATRLTEMWYFVPVSLTASVFPAIINSKKIGEEIYNTRIQKLYNLMIWMSMSVAIIMSFLSTWIIVMLFGEAYQRAGTVLSIQCWMATSVFFGVARTKWLIAEGYFKEGLYIQIIGAGVNIIGNYILIPKYGAVGASTASLVTVFGSNFIAAIFSKPIRLSLKMYGKSLMFPFWYMKNILKEKS